MVKKKKVDKDYEEIKIRDYVSKPRRKVKPRYSVHTLCEVCNKNRGTLHCCDCLKKFCYKCLDVRCDICGRECCILCMHTCVKCMNQPALCKKCVVLHKIDCKEDYKE